MSRWLFDRNLAWYCSVLSFPLFLFRSSLPFSEQLTSSLISSRTSGIWRGEVRMFSNHMGDRITSRHLILSTLLPTYILKPLKHPNLLSYLKSHISNLKPQSQNPTSPSPRISHPIPQQPPNPFPKVNLFLHQSIRNPPKLQILKKWRLLYQYQK